MTKFRCELVACGVGLGLLAAAKPALADDSVTYCHWYARTAIAQSHAARIVSSCRHLVVEFPSRWTLDWNAHYHWCQSVFGLGQDKSELQARRDAMNQCVDQR